MPGPGQRPASITAWVGAPFAVIRTASPTRPLYPAPSPAASAAK